MTLDINGKKRLSENSLLETLCLIDTAVAVYTGEELHIEFANPAMLAAWGKTEEVVGGALSEALPEIAGQPFIGMLRKVWTSGIDDVGMAIPAELIVDGRLQLFYFDYAYRAIKNGAGAVYAILHTATNVTEKINAAFEVEKAKEKQFLLEREQALNEELASTNEELYATNEALQSAQEKLRVLNSELESRVALRTAELSRSESRMRYLFSDAPIAIAVLSGRELVVESANKMILQIWGKSAEVIGSPLYLALPELAEQKFLQVLDDVYTSGVVYHGHEEKALLEQNGKLNEVYLNFVYKPLQDENGCVNGIMVTAHAVTEQVVIREQVQKLNQDLNVINEELNESQLRLLNSNHELKMSEERLNRILGELPIPVVVLIGPEQVISTTNQALLELWDRTREEVIGRTMLEVFPELINQPYPGLWKKVLETGERIMRSEIKVVYKHKETGQDRPFYIDYFCQPLENSTGKRIGVISTVFDVSDKVRSKKLIEEAGEQLKLAIDSARLGTWFVDVETRTFNASDRTRELFGYQPEEKMPFDAAIANISETHREQVTKAIENAIVSGESYDMEYPVVAEKDEAPRWLRATGKRYGNAGDKMYFSGIVQDITMRKVEERKKDDFLSIASHELKTPVTTLKGSLQQG
jgi:PAS domain S-box-containing protein